jgi:hypothetical protein
MGKEIKYSLDGPPAWKGYDAMLKARKLLANTLNKKYWDADSHSYRDVVARTEQHVATKGVWAKPELLNKTCPIAMAPFAVLYARDGAKFEKCVPTVPISKLEKRLKDIFNDGLGVDKNEELNCNSNTYDYGITNITGRQVDFLDFFEEDIWERTYVSKTDGRTHLLTVMAIDTYEVGSGWYRSEYSRGRRGVKKANVHKNISDGLDEMCDGFLVDDVPLPKLEGDANEEENAYAMAISSVTSRGISYSYFEKEVIQKYGLNKFLEIDAWLSFTGRSLWNCFEQWAQGLVLSTKVVVRKTAKDNYEDFDCKDYYMRIPIDTMYGTRDRNDELRRFIYSKPFAERLRNYGVKQYYSQESVASINPHRYLDAHKWSS